MLCKILKISQLINEDPDPIPNNDDIRENYNPNYNYDDEDEYRNYYDEEMYDYFYILQNKEKINFKNFSSPQLRKPENIKVIDKLAITLEVEFDKYVHLRIKDANDTRWEVPERDVLDKEYLFNRNDNKISMSRYTTSYDLQYFSIEVLINQTEKKYKNNNNDNDDPDNFDVDKEIGAKEMDENDDEKEISDFFGFRLVAQENEEFYSFTTTHNFLYSDTYINFESKLTTDKIYGFGERTHDFQLNSGVYTIWPNDCGGTNYDDGKGGMNQYSHQPIALHKTKYSNIWLGFVFLNTNAQDVVIHSDNNSDSNEKKDTFLTHRTIGGIIDYYIIVSDSPEEVVKSIQYLLGVPPLPPFWSLRKYMKNIKI